MQSRFLATVFLAAFALAAIAQTAPPRPKITGISHLAVYTSNPAVTDHYYREIIGAAKLTDPENPQGVRYAFSATQFVDVLPLPPGAGINRLDHTAWNTDNAEGLRKYLAAKGWKTPADVTKGPDGSRWFTVLDPENNKVEFVEPPPNAKAPHAPSVIGHRIIHVGFIVHSQDKENAFYCDLLGFKPYWFGGMKPGRLDWVSQQAPDGHDWLEYMMTGDPSGTGIPAAMSKHDLGVMDHLSIGEVSVDDAYKVLASGSRLSGVHDAHTQIGLDGKGQFNMYDPDGTRLELMNFHASKKPCCSPFTADDPAE